MTRSCQLRLICKATAFIIVTLGIACESLAQQENEGEIVFGVQRKLPTFYFDTPHGYIDLSTQYNNDRIDSAAGDKTRSSNTLVQESVSLSTEGYIVHPNMIDLRLAGTFGLSQDWFDGTDRSGFANGTLYTWDAAATILREQLVPITLYTDRSVNLINQSFGPTLTNTETTYGASAQIRSNSLPTDIRAYHREESQSASLGQGPDNYDLTSNVFQWHTEAHPSVKQSLIWDYSYEQTDQSGISGVAGTSDSNSASIGHSIMFGPTDNFNLSSSLSYTNSTGLFAIERIHWDELLRLKHTKDFETAYEYSLDSQDAFDVHQTSQRATASFRHQLYQSLTTTGRVGWTGFDLSDGSHSDDFSANLSTDYRKTVPFGTFRVYTGVDYDNQQNSSQTGTVTVVDQGFAFTGFQPTFIVQRDIIPTSVIIRDSTGRIFSQGLDYNVFPTGEGIRLDRIPGGAIPDSDPLLLTYDISSLPANETTTWGFNIGTRYDIDQGWLKGVSPYASLHLSNQSISGGAGELLPDNIRDYLIGIEYRNGDFDFTAEHEIYDSSLFPYDTTRLIGRFDHRVSQDTTLGLTASYTMIHYSDPSDRTRTILAGLSASHALARNLIVSASADWLNVNDDQSGHTQGYQEYLEVHYYVRQTEFYGKARNSTLDSDNQNTNFLYLEVGVRREF